jgi:hypothetical protein
VPKKSTISAGRGVGGVDDGVGPPQRVRQAGAGVRVDARAAADRHRLVALPIKNGDGQPADPARAACDRDSHESSSSVTFFDAITDSRYP